MDESIDRDDAESAGGDMLGKVAQVLECAYLYFARCGDGEAIDATDELHATMEAGSLLCHFRFKIHGPDLCMIATLPIFVPSRWRHKMYIAMNAINCKLHFGNFEMDPEDGRLQVRAAMPLQGVLPTHNQLHGLFEAGYRSIKNHGLTLVEAGLTDHGDTLALRTLEQGEK